MSDIDRERAIELIELMMREYEENECMVCEITFGDEEFEALRFARDSLKVDEAYQLEQKIEHMATVGDLVEIDLHLYGDVYERRIIVIKDIAKVYRGIEG